MFETERLLIRPWTDEDRPAHRLIMEDAEVRRYVHGGRLYRDEDADEFFARQARNLVQAGVCMGAVVEKASGRLVGIAGTQPLGTTGNLEVGWIFSRDTWGRGYATEAGGAAVHHVLEVLKRPRVVAIIDPDNVASKRVAARLQMEYEARYTGAQLGHRKPDIIVDLFVRLR